MRLPPPRRLLPVLVLLAVWPSTGCHQAGTADGAPDVQVELRLQPDPPKVGDVVATLRLTGKDGKPLQGATVKLEGNMNHAGMTPVFADAKETQPGRYEATLDLTMGGDWFVLVNATLADGRTLRRKVDVPGVKSR
jgi:YtkA-like protein